MTNVTISDARTRLPDLVNRVSITGERVVIERRGRELVAVVSMEDFELLRALEDKTDLDLIRRRLRESAEPWEKVKASLGISD